MSKEFLRRLRQKHGLGEFKKGNRVTKTLIKRKSQRYSMARRMKRHSKRSNGFAGINIQDVLLMGAGAGASGLVGSQVNRLSGGKLAGNTAQLIAGVSLRMLVKNRMVRKFADGILIKTVGDFVEDNVVPRLQGLNNQETKVSTGEVLIG
ncbi:MAG: hypothetical protein HYW92_03880 [Nitrosarchaeum sp.]|nr:hypothetical protein [Nitrosarchaeum sp.]